MPQKPPDLDQFGSPIGAPPPDLDMYGSPVQQSNPLQLNLFGTPQPSAQLDMFGQQSPYGPRTDSRPINMPTEQPYSGPSIGPPEQKSLWDTYNAPLTDLPSRAAKAATDFFGYGGDFKVPLPIVGNVFSPNQIAEFAGDTVTGMTRPTNIAMGGAGLARSAGMQLLGNAAATPGMAAVGSAVASGSNAVLRGAAGINALKGAVDVVHPDSTLTERAFGVSDILASGAAVKGSTFFDRKPVAPGVVKPQITENALGGKPSVATTPITPTPSSIATAPKLPREVVITDPGKQWGPLNAQGYIPTGKRTANGEIIVMLPTPQELDPNLATGEGNAELAGSQPYKATSGVQPIPGAMDPITTGNHQTIQRPAEGWGSKSGQVMPTEKDYYNSVDQNQSPSADEKQVVRSRVLANASDEEIIRAVYQLQKISGPSETQQIDARILETEVKKRGLLIPNLGPVGEVDPVNAKLERAITGHREFIKNLSEEQITASIYALEESKNLAGKLTPKQEAEFNNLIEELQSRTSTEFDDPNVPKESRNIPFEKPTLAKVERELQTRNVPDDVAQQVKFLLSDGRLRQAQTLLNDYPVKSVAELRDATFSGPARKILIGENGKPPAQVYELAEKMRTNRSEKVMTDLENLIHKENDLEIIADNVRQLDGYLADAKLRGDNDLIEDYGYLRDVAEDHRRMRTPKDLGSIAAKERSSMDQYAKDNFGPQLVKPINLPSQSEDLMKMREGLSDDSSRLKAGIERHKKISDNELQTEYNTLSAIAEDNPDDLISRELIKNIEKEIDSRMGEIVEFPTSEEPSFSRTPKRPFRSNPDRPDLGEHYTGKSNLTEYVDAIDAQDARARELGIDPEDYVNNREELEQAIHDKLNEPSFARSMKDGKRGIKIGVNIRRNAREVTTGYSQPLPAVMVREGLQNAIDAIRSLGANGEVSVTFGSTYDKDYTRKDQTITISDNGRGLTPDELETKLTDLHETGKEGEGKATGGKGIGSASYMLGGAHFKIETVAVDKNGLKYRTTFEGTPDEIFEHADMDIVEVPKHYPTGTKFTTKLIDSPNKQYLHHAEDLLRLFKANSRDLPGVLVANGERMTFPSITNDTTIEYDDLFNNDVKVVIPRGAEILAKTDSINLRILNNGQYQHTIDWYIGDDVADMPGELIVNIEPKMEEGDDLYPFDTSRDKLKDNISTAIKDMIKRGLVNPKKEQQKNRTQELYDSLSKNTNVSGTVRTPTFYDAGNRLTPEERAIFDNSDVIRQLTRAYDTIIDNILTSVEREPWMERLEGVGIVLNEDATSVLHGIHIPNPSTGKSTILINPFSHAIYGGGATNVNTAAFDTVVTSMHEVAHIGSETSDTPITLTGLNDPRNGRLLQSYLNHVLTSTGGDPAHGLRFVKRLGEIYVKHGIENVENDTEHLERIIGSQSGGYNPEFQRLLHIYQESRGRDATEEDFLSRTGEKSENNQQSGEGILPSVSGSNGNGTFVNSDEVGKILQDSIETPGGLPKFNERISVGGSSTDAAARDLAELNAAAAVAPTKANVVKVQQTVPQHQLPAALAETNRAVDQIRMESQLGSGGNGGGIGPDGTITGPNDPAAKKQKTESRLRTVLDAQRTILTAFDMSAPGRQGIGLVTEREFYTSLDDMFKAWGSQKAHDIINFNILNHPSGYFHKRQVPVLNSNGKPVMDRATGKPKMRIAPSVAEEGGLVLTDMIDVTEEVFRSKLAERFIPLVKRSNRAYVSYLNKMRSDYYARMAGILKKDYGIDVAENKVINKQLATMINRATGRGTLNILIPEVPSLDIGKTIEMRKLTRGEVNLIDEKDLNFEGATKALAEVFFAPRLMASRIQTFTQFLNPKFWTETHPLIRRKALRSLFGVAASGILFGKLAEQFGAHVEWDPTNSDFLKIKIGNTRMDPFGGYQQPFVTAAKIILGESTSSKTGRSTDLRPDKLKYGQQTMGDVALNFMTGKLAPLPSLVNAFMWQQEFDGTPFTVKDGIIKRTAPILEQDLKELYEEDPDLMWLGIFPYFGWGIQSYGR